MKKFIIILAIVFGFGLNAYAGGVVDNNNPTAGDILVGVSSNGASSIGHWTDPSFLKGDKGDTGATGLTGTNGNTGTQGIQGVAGQNGGNGFQGEQGVKGDKGDKGNTGATGSQGVHGEDVNPETVNNINNNINTTNQNVANTNNRIDDLNNRVGKLEKPQAIVGLVLRVQDSRKWQTNLFIDYSATRNAVAMYGIRFTYKMGKSYEERRLDELEAKLDRANRTNETLERNVNTEAYVTPSGFGLREKRSF